MRKLLIVLTLIIGVLVATADSKVLNNTQAIIDAPISVTVNITVPTSSATYDAGTSSSIAISGTATSLRGISGPCSWSNNLGGSGFTVGNMSWSIASVALTVGENVVTITCSESGGTSSTDIITITRSSGGGGGVNDKYVRSGGSDAASGADWTNAYATCNQAISATARGNTIWVGDGSIGNCALTKTNSGTDVLTIKKGSIAAHGTETGWSAGYAAQANLGSISGVTDYYVIDGVFRDENDWADDTAYGFRASSYRTSAFDGGDFPQPVSDQITLQYIDFGHTRSDTYNAAVGDCMYISGFASPGANNYTISRIGNHNCNLNFQLAGASDILIEYSWLASSWQKEMIRGQVATHDIVIRHSIFYNGCRDDHNPGQGCTAEIALWGATGNPGTAGMFDNVQIYGNVIWKTLSQANSDACIKVGGDGGVTDEGPAANNALIFNNTIMNAGTNLCTLRTHGSGSGNIGRNNIWYVTGGMSTGCSGTITCDNNSTYTSSPPFVDSSTGDFHLTGALAGSSTGSPAGNVNDMDGVARGGDGTWDRGAFEYEAAAPMPNAATVSPNITTLFWSIFTASKLIRSNP